MAVPTLLSRNLSLPAIVAPMFLASGPDLVVAVCKAGLIGTFPTLNQRNAQGYETWLQEISTRLEVESDATAPFGVNLIVNKSNARLAEDLDITVKYRVPLVITSLGAVREVVDAIHSYGGCVFHDVINLRHAEKAAEAGVDGIIAVCTGAGGHAGVLSPFALIPEIRSIFGGTVVLAGAISTGAQIAAARMMGADLAYLGTRFLATAESMADPAHKQMILRARAKDIVYTPAISGVSANFLAESLRSNGLDPERLAGMKPQDLSDEVKAWKTVWSAGQGVGSVNEILPATELCRKLIQEYKAAHAQLTPPFS